ncbi:DIP1984 family protein [Paenibacillus sp. MZ04-78.2]|nr:DIP1984 family protein [Paenibacillus sp. MZ04-78.2]MCP3776044.1 DIP1984 family protein [Paenibacillus sp. MZ04-78.2]
MKLAEALMNRADCQKRIEQLKVRLNRSAKVQEGEHPPEEPKELFQELNDTLQELESLMIAFNRTNAQTVLHDRITLADALAKRDILAMRRTMIQEVINAAAVKQDRYSRSEVKFIPKVHIAEL